MEEVEREKDKYQKVLGLRSLKELLLLLLLKKETDIGSCHLVMGEVRR